MIPFAYQPGKSFLHKMPTLLRMCLFIFLVLYLHNAPWWLLSAGFLLLCLVHGISRISLKIRWSAALLFLFLCAVIFWGEYGQHGWEAAALRVASFLLTLYASLIFTASTDPVELGESLYRLTKPIPLVPSGKLMILITLTLSFLPMVGEEAQNLRDALKSRAWDRHFSPLRRLNHFAIPLVQTLIRRSDELTYAMYSRCYQEHPTLLSSPLGGRQKILLAFCSLLLCSRWFLPFLLEHYGEGSPFLPHL